MAIIGISIHIQKNKMYDQQAAKRWSEDREMEQITLFYPITQTESLDSFFFMNLTHQIQDALDKSAFASETGAPDEQGITFPYSISIEGKIVIENENKKAETRAVGIDGEFFVFHPVNLLYGSFISGEDLMKDGIVIDDEIAWKLFGSADVAGKMVTIDGIPYYIRGVCKKDESRLAKEAGLDSSIAYVSVDTLSRGKKYGSYTYEVILPNPVEDFALKLVQDTLGTANEEIEIVDNSTRFKASRWYDIVTDTGVRSMSKKALVYPYFENWARAYEDIFAIGYMAMYLMGTIIIIFLIIHFVKIWKQIKRRSNYENKKNRCISFVRNLVSNRMRKKEE